MSATTSLLPIPGGPQRKSGRFALNAFRIALRACTDVTVRLSETADAIINSYMLVAY